MTTPKRAVYTALMGSYEDLGEQPIASSSDIPFICFTDSPAIASSSWDIRIVKPAFPEDSVRSARAIKIRGDQSLGDFDETLWIDNTVMLKKDPAELLDDWLADTDFALPRHSYRGTVAAEFDVIVRSGLDDPARVYEQLEAYGSVAASELQREALWTAILARRDTPETRATMQVWLDNVLRYSRRDQLSIAFAISSTAQRVRIVDLDNFASEWHEWPVERGRQRPPLSLVAARSQPSTPVMELARLVADVDDLTLLYNNSVSSREADIGAMLVSRSWRWTLPLRKLTSVARALRARFHKSA